jgi:hypothetical protein
VDVALDASGMLTFGNAAVRHGFASVPAAYRASWYAFDNATGESRQLGQTSSPGEERLAAPVEMTVSPGAYFRVELSADHNDHPRWKEPVHAYFRRDAAGWKLVGFERTP